MLRRQRQVQAFMLISQSLSTFILSVLNNNWSRRQEKMQLFMDIGITLQKLLNYACRSAFFMTDHFTQIQYAI